MATPQPKAGLLPNAANIQTAITGMTTEGGNISTSLQAFTDHQQNLAVEQAKCANFPIAGIQQQIITFQQTANMIDAKISNIEARIKHSQIRRATDVLTVMQSIDQGANARVPVGHDILDFPNTPDDISQMTALECRNLLTSLAIRVAAGATDRELQTLVRGAIGLPAL